MIYMYYSEYIGEMCTYDFVYIPLSIPRSFYVVHLEKYAFVDEFFASDSKQVH